MCHHCSTIHGDGQDVHAVHRSIECETHFAPPPYPEGVAHHSPESRRRSAPWEKRPGGPTLKGLYIVSHGVEPLQGSFCASGPTQGARPVVATLGYDVSPLQGVEPVSIRNWPGWLTAEGHYDGTAARRQSQSASRTPIHHNVRLWQKSSVRQKNTPTLFVGR